MIYKKLRICNVACIVANIINGLKIGLPKVIKKNKKFNFNKKRKETPNVLNFNRKIEDFIFFSALKFIIIIK